MGSTRFPGKVLADLAGKPLLERLVNRLRAVPDMDELIVAISVLPGDDILEQFCSERGYTCYRGSELDVLQRYVDAAAAFNLDVVIRVCSDAPLTDPDGIMELRKVFEQGGTRFVHNRFPGGWPAGGAADLMTTDALLEAVEEADQPHHREHAASFLSENPDRFNMKLVHAPTDLHRPNYHLAIDRPEELDLLRRIYAEVGGENPDNMPLRAVIRWCDRNL